MLLQPGTLRFYCSICSQVWFSLAALESWFSRADLVGVVEQYNLDELDANGRTPAVYATLGDQVEALEYLVSAGAQVQQCGLV